MIFKTLEKISVAELTNLFNGAFSDYFVKIELTPEILAEKIYSEDIVLNQSLGCFSEDKPVGFILHGIRKEKETYFAYNAGTGVLPAFRGKNATVKMYEHILPELKKSGVSNVELEVMEQNIPAIKSYQKIGFAKTGNLECFKGSVVAFHTNENLEISETDISELKKFQHFGDWNPSWQHSTETLLKTSSYKMIIGHLNKVPAGYVVFNPDKGRVPQFAVNPKYRKMKIATTLLQHISNYYCSDFSFINVDGIANPTIDFLKALEMQHFLTQYKMELKL